MGNVAPVGEGGGREGRRWSPSGRECGTLVAVTTPAWYLEVGSQVVEIPSNGVITPAKGMGIVKLGITNTHGNSARYRDTRGTG